MTRSNRVAAFRALHTPGTPFVMPNPWDLGSARVLAALGAKALATTSSGFAFTRGLTDGARISREAHLEHAREMVEATDLPINGDFENGYGRDPETVAETVRLAAEAGLAGVGIEDIDLPGAEAYPFDLAVERIAAAAEAAQAVDIVLTARADGWMTRAYDADEVLRRADAFAEAGAEVIYAPLVKAETIKALCAVGKPVNVLAAGPALQHTVAELGEMGAARISVGGALARVTHKVIVDAGRAMLEGDLAPLRNMANGAEIDAMLTG